MTARTFNESEKSIKIVEQRRFKSLALSAVFLLLVHNLNIWRGAFNQLCYGYQVVPTHQLIISRSSLSSQPTNDASYSIWILKRLKMSNLFHGIIFSLNLLVGRWPKPNFFCSNDDSAELWRKSIACWCQTAGRYKWVIIFIAAQFIWQFHNPYFIVASFIGSVPARYLPQTPVKR